MFEEFIGVNPWTAALTLCNFLLVLYVGKRFLYAPLLKIIHDRQKEIDDMYLDAESAKQEAEAMRVQYRERLETAQADGERIVKEAVARGQAREEEILRQAGAEAAALRQKVSEDIAMEKQKVLTDAKDEISEMAVAIAEKVVGREMNATDQDALVDEFIRKLGENA